MSAQISFDAIRSRLRLPEVGQIGYVVADISEAIAECQSASGMGPWLLLDERPEPCIERGARVHARIKIALTYVGPIQIELIQVMEGETYHRRHVEEHREGPHHLGFMIQGIERRLESCRQAGIEVLQRGTIKDTGGTVEYAYLDTVEQAGIVLELIQWRLGPIPLAVNRRVFNLICGIGSWTFFRGRVVK